MKSEVAPYKGDFSCDWCDKPALWIGWGTPPTKGKSRGHESPDVRGVRAYCCTAHKHILEGPRTTPTPKRVRPDKDKDQMTIFDVL